jgi:PTH1 family peptidyl-tRNA hydrolase
LIIHDDIDLAFGRIKIKEKGGHGGHNGVRSLIDAFGGGDFPRLRIGVGRSGAGNGIVDYVLGNFDADEVKLMSRVMERARDAVVTFLCKGTKEAMNGFNNKQIVISS